MMYFLLEPSLFPYIPPLFKLKRRQRWHTGFNIDDNSTEMQMFECRLNRAVCEKTSPQSGAHLIQEAFHKPASQLDTRTTPFWVRVRVQVRVHNGTTSSLLYCIYLTVSTTNLQVLFSTLFYSALTGYSHRNIQHGATVLKVTYYSYNGSLYFRYYSSSSTLHSRVWGFLSLF